MKKFSKLSSVLALGAAVCVGSATAAEPLTVVSWGGAYTKSQRMAYSDPFTAKTGIKIVDEDKSGNGLAGLRAQTEAGNVTWDVLDILEGDAILACDEGIAQELDYEKDLNPGADGTPVMEDFIEGSLSGCYVPTIVYATLFSFNDKAFPGEKPKTIADVFDVKKFPGKRAFEKKPDANLEWALAADGVPYDEVYDVLGTPEGVERAFAKLDTIKDSIIWWDAGAQPPQLLADGEVAIASAYNGRIFNAQVVENQPFTIIWDGQVYELDGYIIPKGAPHKKAAMDYLRFATDTQRLADQTKYISYGPARKSSAPLVDSHAETGVKMAPHMPTTPVNFKTPIKKDAEFWADNGDELRQRFNAWLVQ
ncbi:ABC transporter substrate-binding protein [Amphritea sp. 2_MG-2023]|jgi:putative spermidine/putrescine transport system substrate-binding protein|uniref:ABC transporter substrate-binding protein n=1 Tax=Amphritea TaxID=515417 RepID=UPI001C07D2E9|nr:MULTISPECIES: ABC transporter substrate-binding protein [Amphritea]MBU2966970.1 ABC transporter substrate-binding protein [Amphritea atlantica]MDO6420336.1 ABC transporter substrate-binding protein [Amphritea sp. 2_MG-2023]MDX2423666.1 ABC transporter substrate-binding protein [Amphritea sp.]